MKAPFEYEFKGLGKLSTEVPEDIDTSKWSFIFNYVESQTDGQWLIKDNKLFPVIEGKTATASLIKTIPQDNGNLGTSLRYIVTSVIWTPSIVKEDIKPFQSIPDRVYEFIAPYICYTIQDDASRHLILKKPGKGNQWKQVADPIGHLQATPKKKKKYIERLDEQLKAIQMEGCRWGVKTLKGLTEQVYLNFTDCWVEYELAEKIKDDRRFYQPIQGFTNDSEVACENYFPLDNLEAHCKGSLATWEKFEKQMPAWAIKTWRAAIYGIYDAKNRSRQVIYIQDEGLSGKTIVANALATMGGDGFYASMDTDGLKSQFWGWDICGARLILLPDTANPKILMTDKVKRITGGDIIRVEQKGQNSFNYRPNSRLIITTNKFPEIDVSKRNQLSRVLFFPLSPFDKSGGTISVEEFEHGLKAEFWDYLLLCKEAYEELCPNCGDIEMPEEMIEVLRTKCIFSESEDMEDVFSCLTTGEGKELTNAELKAVMVYVEHIELTKAGKFEEFKRNVLTQFKNIESHRTATARTLKGVGLASWLDFRDGEVFKKKTSTINEEKKAKVTIEEED